MPTLNWLGKDAVVDHHRKVPLRLLADDSALAIPAPGGLGETAGAVTHTLIEGDNLHALKALLPRYRGRVDCIYIDPPYNTGNEGWVYNDNVNSPLMRDWLKREVGRDDLSRHDKWLCMMYPRLVLMRELLAQDGVIFISIDDNEFPFLSLLLDMVLGSACRIANLIWKSRQFLDMRSLTGISNDHEYILAYSKHNETIRFKGKARDNSKYSNPDNDPRGLWMSRSILGLANKAQRPNLHYDLVNPQTGISYPCPSNTGWRYNRETMSGKLSEGKILFPKKPSGRPREKVFLQNLTTEGAAFPSIITDIFTADGSKEIRDIFGEQSFAFPKPSSLIAELIQQVCGPNAIILDAFAGSGTTGQAVMALNTADDGRRECVLIQLGQDQADGANIAQSITRERLARVSQGYTNAKGEAVAGLNQAWRYQRLGESFTDGWGMPRTDLHFADLAPIVFFHATQEPIPQPAHDRAFLGVSSTGVGVYLLYNGDMTDKDGRSRNVLTQGMLERLHPHPGPRIVYGAACRIDDRDLASARITFRQYPKALAEVAS